MQKQILIGTLLGDAHLETSNSGKTYRLKIEHCLAQKFYIDWLYEYFKDWVLTEPQIKANKPNIWFQTLSHPAMRFYAQQFYVAGLKKVPKLTYKWLTPLALAVWFMDDGSLKSREHRALILNTQGYNQDDIKILQKALETSHSIKTQLRKQKDGIQLLIVDPDSTKFAKIIQPYLLPQFWYKLGKIGLTLLPKV